MTGVDLSETQLTTARENLARTPWCSDRYTLQQADAGELSFEARSFDSAFLCWVLEHVPSPARVLSEVRRVLAPFAGLHHRGDECLVPARPVFAAHLALLDGVQRFPVRPRGDPFVGAKLGNLLLAGGFRDVHTEIKTIHLDNREPARRKTMIAFWEQLLSVADQLLQAGSVDEETVEGMRREFRLVQNGPNAVFFYSFVQGRATCIEPTRHQCSASTHGVDLLDSADYGRMPDPLPHRRQPAPGISARGGLL